MDVRPGRGRHIDRSKRTVSGQYFDLACALVNVSQEEVARRAGIPASKLSRGFSGRVRVKREKLLAWGDILFELCPPEDREFLSSMEREMLHTLGHSTREDEQQGIERLAYYRDRVNEVLSKRQQGKP